VNPSDLKLNVLSSLLKILHGVLSLKPSSPDVLNTVAEVEVESLCNGHTFHATWVFSVVLGVVNVVHTKRKTRTSTHVEPGQFSDLNTSRTQVIRIEHKK